MPKLESQPFESKLDTSSEQFDKNKIIKALNDCLLKEEEVLKGRDYWIELEDPFHKWI